MATIEVRRGRKPDSRSSHATVSKLYCNAIWSASPRLIVRMKSADDAHPCERGCDNKGSSRTCEILDAGRGSWACRRAVRSVMSSANRRGREVGGEQHGPAALDVEARPISAERCRACRSQVVASRDWAAEETRPPGHREVVELHAALHHVVLGNGGPQAA